MGIHSIRLEEEGGRVIREIDGDPHGLDRLLPDLSQTRYQCIRFIDEYGDTVFNRLQMDQFLTEWAELAARAATAEDRVLIEAVRRLAEDCRAEPHRYLRFCGD